MQTTGIRQPNVSFTTMTNPHSTAVTKRTTSFASAFWISSLPNDSRENCLLSLPQHHQYRTASLIQPCTRETNKITSKQSQTIRQAQTWEENQFKRNWHNVMTVPVRKAIKITTPFKGLPQPDFVCRGKLVLEL